MIVVELFIHGDLELV